MLVLFVCAEKVKLDTNKNEPSDPSIVLFLLPFCLLMVKGCIDSNIISELCDC